MNYDEKNTEGLENLLHSKLQGFAPEAPESIWQAGIEPQIRARRQRRKLIFWWWGFTGAVGLVAVAILFFLGKREKNLPEKIHETMPVAAVAVPSDFEKLGEISNPSKQKTSADFSKSHFKKPENSSDHEKTHRSKLIFKNENQQEKSNLNSNFEEKSDLKFEKKSDQRTLETILENQNLTRRTDVPTNISDEKFGSPLVEKLPLIFLKNVILEKKTPCFSPIPTHFAEKTTQKIKQPAQFWATAEAGLVAPMPHDIHQTVHGGMTFTEKSTVPATGFQTGFSLQFQPRERWRFGIGLLRQATRQTTSHIATLRLMDGVCLNPYDPGVKHYEFQYTLISDGDPAKVNLRLSQQDPNIKMPDDEPFILDMKTTRRNTDWLVPITAQRFFGSARRWQFFLKSGATLRFSQKTAIRVDHFTEACVDLCFQNGLTPTVTTQNIRQFSMGYLVGAGAEWTVSPRFRVSFHPNLNGYFSKTNGRSHPSARQFGLNTGLSFQL